LPAIPVVRARIDEETKREAAAVLQAMGLTVSDAFRLMMVKIAKEKALPFKPLVPNKETIDAMKAARRGELTTAGTPGKLLKRLNADCTPYRRIAVRANGLLGLKLRGREHEGVEEAGEYIVGVQREYVSDILIGTDNDDAALIPVDAP
jgi:DNA-damage-inducible protein J